MIKNICVVDFETCNSDNDIAAEKTNVWLWDICEMESLEHKTGLNLDSFFEYLKTYKSSILYSHNLKFDGNFIIYYLLTHGYKWSKERVLNEREFNTLITVGGVFYKISVMLKKGNKKRKIEVEFRDSTKKLKGKVSYIAKSYKLPILKGEINYKLQRGPYYQPTQKEIDYIHNDTEIIARALQTQYAFGANRLTTASDTLSMYKTYCGIAFKILFPIQTYETDSYIRESYRGGVCMVEEKIKGKELNRPVYIYDVNSMYPDKMANALLPYDDPIFFKGKYKRDKLYPLYISRVSVCFALKENYKPTILDKRSFFGKQKYLENSEGQMLELTLTSVDLELMFKHYEIYDIEYIDGYKFRGSRNLFKGFILPLYDKKCSTQGAEKETYKLFLNALYGKFASNPEKQQKIPYLENDKVEYECSDVSIEDSIYTAVSVFITAEARKQLFTTIQNNYENFVYCDTDSVHLLSEIKEEIISENELGKYKLEKIYVKAKYLAQKTYYGVISDTKKDIKCAGCPDSVKEKLTFEKFNFGFSAMGKLLPKVVSGGVVLTDTSFTIKAR